MLRIILQIFLLFPVLNAMALNTGDNSEWFFSEMKEVRGVILVAHGLNLKPSKMDAFVKVFTEAGYDVYRPAFAGHRGDFSEMQRVSVALWQQEARFFYTVVNKRAEYLHVPLFLFGYSMGALLYSNRELIFTKKVYLAPALYPSLLSTIVGKIIQFFPGDWRISSRNLPEYRANDYTGFRSVQVIMALIDRYDPTQDQSEVKVYFDPRDELINTSKIERLANEKKWKIFKLDNSLAAAEKKIHHAIIDEFLLGKAEWQNLIKDVLKEFI